MSEWHESMPRTVELAESIFLISKLSWRDASQKTTQLTESEFLALDYLAGAGTATVGAVKDHIRVLAAQMSRLVRSLEDAGFVTCELNSADRRRVNLTITKTGRKAHEKYREAKLAPIVQALERLTADEREQFMTFVEKMAARQG